MVFVNETISVLASGTNLSNKPSFKNGDCYGDSASPVCILIVVGTCLVIVVNSFTFLISVMIIKNLKNRGGNQIINHHKGAFYLVANLSFADLLTGLGSLTAYIWDYILQVVLKGFEDIYTCRTHDAFIMVPFTASLLSVLAIAIDRYIYIKNSLHYNTILTTKRIRWMIVIIWGLALTNALSIGMEWTFGRASGKYYYRCNIAEAMSDSYLIVYGLLYNIIPITVAAALYMIVFIESYKAKRRLEDRNLEILKDLETAEEKRSSKELFKMNLFHKSVAISNIVPSHGNMIGTFKSLDVENLKDEFEEAKSRAKSLRQTQKRQRSFMDNLKTINEIKGTYALGSLVLVVTLFWFPFSVGMIAYVANSSLDKDLAAQINTTFVMLGIFNSLINPFLYAFGYREFRRNLFIVFKYTKCLINKRKGIYAGDCK